MADYCCWCYGHGEVGGCPNCHKELEMLDELPDLDELEPEITDESYEDEELEPTDSVRIAITRDGKIKLDEL